MSDPTKGKPGEIHSKSELSAVKDGSQKTWASVLRLSRSACSSMENNVLEVVLEKDTRGSFVVTEDECFNLIRRLGLDPVPGTQVTGVQICPNGRGSIYITLRKEVDISKYFRYDVFQVTNSGTRAVLVKPVGKRDIVVTIKGIHPSTKDDTVIDYLRKFGHVTTTKVIYGLYLDGPLKGLRNGDRCYKMEVKSNDVLGSYHVLDGHKVYVRFPGMVQTCARCLQSAHLCKGNGMAKKCEAEGGLKANFPEYILKLWEKVSYSPPSNTSDEEYQEYEEEISAQDGGW